MRYCKSCLFKSDNTVGVTVRFIHTWIKKFPYDFAPCQLFLLVRRTFFLHFPLRCRFKDDCYVDSELQVTGVINMVLFVGV